MNNVTKLALIAVLIFFLLSGCSQNSSFEPAKQSTTVSAATASEAMAITTLNEATVIADMTKAIVSDSIHIDQIGYNTADAKCVIVNGKDGIFEVVDNTSGKPAFKGQLNKGPEDAASGDNVWYGDFTKLTEPGKYCIFIPDLGLSYPFTIGDGIYGNLKDALLKGLYYQRCGMALDEKYAGQWAHPVCHTEKGIIYGNEIVKLAASGGWHDAGDYGKYTVAGATAVEDLLLAWELLPGSFGDDTNIPESGNKVPDILDEAKYELEWMLKMQDTATGGVYHKLTSKGFPSLNTAPQDDFGELYFLPVSATATGDFAAVEALASRIYKTYDPVFSKKCLNAALKAWGWLDKNKNVPGFKNPSDITTGEYGDSNDSDERLWAAVELYRTTGKAEYNEYIKSTYKNTDLEGYGLGWQNVAGFAKIAYLYTPQDKRDSAVYDYYRNELFAAADAKINTSSSDGYLTTLNLKDYGWGSNMNLMDDGMLLILANMQKPNGKYVAAVMNNLHFLMGCNALSQNYVTGFGSKTILNPHHRMSKSDNAVAPVPGLVAGGPNANLEDDIAKSSLKNKPAARCYIDNSGSYSTNEIAIYWNSPAVFVAAFVD